MKRHWENSIEITFIIDLTLVVKRENRDLMAAYHKLMYCLGFTVSCTRMVISLFVISFSAHAQMTLIRSDAFRVLDMVTEDSTLVPFLPYTQTFSAVPLFQPEGITPVMKSDLHLNKFVRTSKGLFMVIEGTGRVYRIDKAGAGRYDFVRVDSTTHVGYNFGASVFAFRDTIFSVGGYGLWQLNGQMRYFRPDVFGWEIVRTNRRVQVREPDLGFFLDKAGESVWYVNRSNNYQDLTPAALREMPAEDSTIFRLDLNRKTWHVMGRVTDQFLAWADERSIFAVTAQATLTLGGTAQEPRVFQFDYGKNEIRELKEKALCQHIRSAVVSRTNQPHQIVTWFRHDSLTVVNGGVKTHVFHLPDSMFKTTGRIFIPDTNAGILGSPDRWGWPIWLLVGFIPGLSFGYFMMLRKEKVKNQTEPDREIFSVWERRVLQAFQQKPGLVLSVDEMDEILQTTARSKDAQNQKRSAITRSINNKYSLLTNDTENLIETRRQEFDRRMISYYLSEEKFAVIKDKVGKEEEGG